MTLTVTSTAVRSASLAPRRIAIMTRIKQFRHAGASWSDLTEVVCDGHGPSTSGATKELVELGYIHRQKNGRYLLTLAGENALSRHIEINQKIAEAVRMSA
jgi:hypothetical protein